MLASAGNTYFPLFAYIIATAVPKAAGIIIEACTSFRTIRYIFTPCKTGGNFVTDKAKAGLNFA